MADLGEVESLKERVRRVLDEEVAPVLQLDGGALFELEISATLQRQWTDDGEGGSSCAVLQEAAAIEGS